ncbi:hypothetical protein Pstr01_30630 [Pseudomonas straminea]|uniref:Uncharacterized protein n=1 Tax=Pseudomonas straminea TaxID=47882 RepID=A0A1I1WET9_PSEOC|nr:hypothetical protein FB481_104221 [Pseudomonas sp. AG1028]GLX14824.1 hypothetical protein Pstr01_30630 [Pseudomonas straminea]SFD93725.1 hypothetical protein SAMN05216372_105460 [Pseudomonas straminea]
MNGYYIANQFQDSAGESGAASTRYHKSEALAKDWVVSFIGEFRTNHDDFTVLKSPQAEMLVSS